VNININIGHSIQNAQIMTGMKSVEVAKELDVSKQLFRYITKNKDISFTRAVKLINIFDMSLSEFIKLGEQDPDTFKKQYDLQN